MFAAELLNMMNAPIDYSKTAIYEKEYEDYKNSMRELVNEFNLTKRSNFVKYDLELPNSDDGTYKNNKIKKIVDYLKVKYETKKHKALLIKLLLIRCRNALIYPDELIHEMCERLRYKEDIDIDKAERTTQRFIKRARFAEELKQDIDKFIEEIDNEFEIKLPDNDGYSFFECIKDEIED